MFRSIMVPLSKPVFVTLFLLYFVGTYNDVYEANLYLLSENKYKMCIRDRCIVNSLLLLTYFYLPLLLRISVNQRK